MKLLVLQHVTFEGPAAIANWVKTNNHSMQQMCCTQSSKFPSLDEFDCLIIMGGPMSVNDDLAWIKPEVAFIKQCIDADKYVLGVCLGAQLIAIASGASVSKNAVREIGWFPVFKTRSKTKPQEHWANNSLPERFTPLHWHGDTFSLTSAATLLYESEACKSQAFTLGKHVLGLQFHLEFDLATATRLAQECAEELGDSGPMIQSEDEILSAGNHFSDNNQLLYKLLDAMHLNFVNSAR